MQEDSEILSKVNGEFIAAASQLLPPADTATDESLSVEIDAGHAGRVRLYAKRQKAKHHKHSHWFWSFYRAEQI